MGQKASPDSAEVALVASSPPADLLCLPLARRKVMLDFSSVAQVIGNDGIHVGQRQSGVSLYNRLRGSAILERSNHQFQQDAGVADAHRTGVIFT